MFIQNEQYDLLLSVNQQGNTVLCRCLCNGCAARFCSFDKP